MNVQLPQLMTVDEFLVWAEGRQGRYELVEGVLYQMSPERARHAEAKLSVVNCLRSAIKRAALPCFAMPDGMTVRINARTAYEPDALVYCGKKLEPNDIEVPNPVIVVEVGSPGTKSRDSGLKLSGYFSLPSIRHVLLVDAELRVVTHHERREDGAILTHIIREGALRLEPPGLSFDIAEFFDFD